MSITVTAHFSDGTPAAHVELWGSPVGHYYGYEGGAFGPGIRRITFDEPGKYCVWLEPGGEQAGYPDFTLDSSGSLIRNSDTNTSQGTYNPDCSISVDEAGVAVDVTFPAFTAVQGTAIDKDGMPCDASMGASSRTLYWYAGADSNYSDGSFIFYLTPGKWELSALNREDEYGPTAPSKRLTVGTDPITGLQVQCGGNGSGG